MENAWQCQRRRPIEKFNITQLTPCLRLALLRCVRGTGQRRTAAPPPSPTMADQLPAADAVRRRHRWPRPPLPLHPTVDESRAGTTAVTPSYEKSLRRRLVAATKTSPHRCYLPEETWDDDFSGAAESVSFGGEASASASVSARESVEFESLLEIEHNSKTRMEKGEYHRETMFSRATDRPCHLATPCCPSRTCHEERRRERRTKKNKEEQRREAIVLVSS